MQPNTSCQLALVACPTITSWLYSPLLLHAGTATHLHDSLVAEWWAFKPAYSIILSSRGHTEWAYGTVVNRVDELGVATDVPDGGARVPQEDMPKPTQRRE